MQERPLVATLATKVSHRRKNDKSPGFRYTDIKVRRVFNTCRDGKSRFV
jgi:hypothetical protein